MFLTHSCGDMGELTYGLQIVAAVKDDQLVGEIIKRLRLHSKTTQEHYPFVGRITDLMASGKVFEDLGVAQISSEIDHAMIFGSMGMLHDTKEVLEGFGLVEGSNNRPKTFVVERAFVG